MIWQLPRIYTGGILCIIAIVAWYVPLFFYILWGSIAVWIFLIEWPRLAPWYSSMLFPAPHLTLISWLYAFSQTKWLVATGIIAASLFDTGSYIMGNIGEKYYITSISPHKTWQGVLGGFVTLYSISLLWAYLDNTTPYIYTSIPVFLLGTAAFGGDLLVSWLKRRAHIKDCSNALPGHGGILDRCDSMLWCVPMAYICYLCTLL